MASTSTATAPASLYSDTNAFPAGELFQSGPAYPSALANGHFTEPRRAISSPHPPSALLAFGHSRGAHDLRSTIQRFGHRIVNESDIHTLKELIALHTAEIISLEAQLLEADRLFAEAEERTAYVNREVSRGAFEKGGHEVLSAQAIRESVLQGRCGIHDRILQLKRLRETHAGLLHPIRRLPMELLMMIMQFAVVQEEFDRRMAILQPDLHSLTRNRHSPPVRINSLDEASNPNETSSTRHHSSRTLPIAVRMSHVCSFWRTAAHRTPDLWRTIRFRLTGQPDVGLQSRSMVKLFMDKARHDPIATGTPSHAGMRLVFTGWVEHEHPSANDTLKSFLQGLMHSDAKLSPFDPSIPAADAPSHSRRYSDAPSTIELSLTPDSEAEDAPSNTVVPPGISLMGDNAATREVHTFRIARLEIDFHELCEHEVIAGQSRNSQLRWHSKCPKPEEVVFIAKDSVYRASRHGDDTNLGLLSPPYSKSLIPYAKEVTLCNLSFDWASPSRSDDPYANLTSLKLIYTCHFDRLLVKPENMDNRGFLQFLKVARNLVDLEIRLPTPPPVSPTSSATSDATVFASPATTISVLSNGAPSISIPASLHRLIISLPDLCRMIPLFLPESSRPSAPTIALPSLSHLSILPHDTQGALEPGTVERNAQLVRDFYRIAEANIKHLEFLHPGNLDFPAYDLTSAAHARRPNDAEDQMSFLLKHFESCKTLEVWGGENVKALIAIVGVTQATAAPPIAIESSLDAPSVLHPSERTSSSSPPVETAVSKAQSAALRNHSSSSAPQSNIPNSLSPPTTKSPNKISKSPRRSPSSKPKTRTSSWLSTPREIIAKIVAPLSRHSLAIVETPVGTPKMVIDDLPVNAVPDFGDLHDPGLLAPPNISMRSSGSHPDVKMHSKVASSSRIDASALGYESSALASSLSQDNHSNPGIDVHEGTSLPKAVKRIIVHDGISFTPSIAAVLSDREIEVVVHG